MTSSVVKYDASLLPEDELGIYRSATSPDELIDDVLSGHLDNCWHILQKGCLANEYNPCLGTLYEELEDYCETNDQFSSEVDSFFFWLNYKQVCELAIIINEGFNAFQLTESMSFPMYGPLKLVGVFFENRAEWIILEQACNLSARTLVSIYATLGTEALLSIFKETEVATVVVSSKELNFISNLMEKSPESFSLKNLILLPPKLCRTCLNMVDKFFQNGLKQYDKTESIPSISSKCSCDILLEKLIETSILRETEEKAENEKVRCVTLKVNEKIRVYTWKALLVNGIENSQKDLSWKTVSSESTRQTLNTICYTSGTSGNPKGVCLTHNSFLSAICGSIRGPFSLPWVSITSSDCHLSYLPLPHVYERIIVYLALFCGAKIGFSSGNIKNILRDVCLLQPTVFISVPRVFERLHNKIEETIQSKNIFLRNLVKFCLFQKEKQRKINPSVLKNFLWDQTLLRQFRNILGGKIRYMVVAGASLRSSIAERLSLQFSVPFVEVYGLTESAGPVLLCQTLIDASGCFSIPFPSCEFKVKSVESSSYTTKSNPPRGELLIRGKSMMAGYFQKAEETKKVLTMDGWFFTGDIVELEDTENKFSLKIIDRKSQLFKLANGEFICPEKLENIYRRLRFVDQLYIPAQTSAKFLVCILVLNEAKFADFSPETSTLTSSTDSKSSTINWKDKTLVKKIKGVILKALNEVADHANLCGFEKIKNLWITTNSFSIENDQLTQTLKLKRHVLKNEYKEIIDSLYEEGTYVEKNPST